MSNISLRSDDSQMSLGEDRIFHGLTKNVVALSLAVATLNYNIGLTSYMLYLMNLEGSLDDTSILWTSLNPSFLLGGLFAGQLFYGFFGTYIGRVRSFQACNLLMFFGSLGGGIGLIIDLVTGTNSVTVHLTENAIFKLFFGFGAGGLYPVMATVTKESSQSAVANSTLALVFGPLGSIGFILAPLIVMILSTADFSTQTQWRIAMALGIFPSTALLFLQKTDGNSKSSKVSSIQQQINGREREGTESGGSRNSASAWDKMYIVFEKDVAVLLKPPLYKLLLGTMLSWFCSDILYYSTFLLQFEAIYKIVAKGDYDDDYTLSLTSYAAIGMVSAISFWIGGLFAVHRLRKISALALQVQGFTISAIFFFLGAVSKAVLPDDLYVIPLLLYFGCCFCLGYGPAPTTFLSCSFIFPVSVSSTANGIASAFGKIGAIVIVFAIQYLDMSVINYLGICSAVSILGVGSTMVTLKQYFPLAPTRQETLDREAAYVDSVLVDADSFDPFGPLSDAGAAGAGLRDGVNSGANDSRNARNDNETTPFITAP